MTESEPKLSPLVTNIALRNSERTYFADIFQKAGFQHVALEEIPNQYWRDKSTPPWFMATTEQGFFVIGWRKRVISIEWHDINVPAELFSDQDVTKGFNHIHAWGVAKAIEYLIRIRERSPLPESSHSAPRYRAETHKRLELERRRFNEVIERAHLLEMQELGKSEGM